MATVLQHKYYARLRIKTNYSDISLYLYFYIHLPAMTAEQLKAMRDRLYVLGGFL